MLACGAVPTRWTRAGPQSRGPGAHANDRDLGAITRLRAFAHPTRRGGEGHGHADTGLELARGNHSPGRRRERNRGEAAAAAGAELDLEPARDASAAAAFGAALFDAVGGLARIWRCGAPATRLDVRRLCRLPGVSPDLRDRPSLRGHRRRARRDLCPRTRRKRVGADDAARPDRADLARTAPHHGGRAPPTLPSPPPPPPPPPPPSPPLPPHPHTL